MTVAKRPLIVPALAAASLLLASCAASPPTPKFKPHSEQEMEMDDLSDDNAMYRDACNAGNDVSCHDLAKALDEDLQGGQAMNYYDKGCNLGYPLSCTALGDKHYKGHDTERNFDRAFDLFTRACDGGDMTACVSLGVMHAKGEATEKNTDKARELYKRACAGGYNYACDWQDSAFD